MFHLTHGDMEPDMEAWMARVSAGRQRARARAAYEQARGAPPDIDERLLRVREDTPDLRDWWYRPSLARLAANKFPAFNLEIIRDQGKEGSCTGMALAAVIDRLRGVEHEKVSERMLYEMARRHDEWEGEDGEGSSVRGAIKGFFQNGVCLQNTWKYADQRRGALTYRRADEARRIGLGAYYRLAPDINHYHSALNEVDAILVSAHVHPGWGEEAVRSETYSARAVIRLTDDDAAHANQMHAFAVVGYTEKGFLVQNSWGRNWGGFYNPLVMRDLPGIALWPYEDWAQTISDAWVLRLGVSTPTAFGIRPRKRAIIGPDGAPPKASAARRKDIAHHFVHISGGKLVDRGLFPNTDDDVEYLFGDMLLRDRAALEREIGAPIRRLLIFANGGMIPTEDAAARIADLRPGFLRNGVYPLHILWGTGPIEELFELFMGAFRRVFERMGAQSVATTDRAIEKVLGFGGRALWRDIKEEAARAVSESTPLVRNLRAFLDADHAHDAPLEIHVAAYSAGAYLLGELLDALLRDADRASDALARHLRTISLIAPACSVDFADRKIFGALRGKLPDGPDEGDRGEAVKIYALSDAVEEADNLGPYGASALEVVSRVFETADAAEAQDIRKDVPVLGLARHLGPYLRRADLGAWRASVALSGEENGGACAARGHYRFLNDAQTMNDLLHRVIGAPPRAFRPEELSDAF